MATQYPSAALGGKEAIASVSMEPAGAAETAVLRTRKQPMGAMEQQSVAMVVVPIHSLVPEVLAATGLHRRADMGDIPCHTSPSKEWEEKVPNRMDMMAREGFCPKEMERTEGSLDRHQAIGKPPRLRRRQELCPRQRPRPEFFFFW